MSVSEKLSTGTSFADFREQNPSLDSTAAALEYNQQGQEYRANLAANLGITTQELHEMSFSMGELSVTSTVDLVLP